MRLTRAAASLAAVLVSASAVACAAAANSRAGGYGGASLVREDRVVVGQFRDVTGVAVSRRYVFATSPGLLAVYDRTFGRWLPPVAASADLPLGRVTAIAADPTSDGVWVGGAGTVTYYQPGTDYTTRTSVPGVVQRIVFDRRSLGLGAFVAAQGGWFRVSTGGLAQPVAASELPRGADAVVAPSLEDLYREYPNLQSGSGLFTRDALLRSYPISAAAKSPDRANEVWVGTLGGGLLRVDPAFQQATPIPFGLQDPGVGALARAADGVWVGGLGTALASAGSPGSAYPSQAHGGLTFVDDALQEFRQVTAERGASADDALRGARVFDLAVRDGVAWAATDRGLARVATRDGATSVWTGTNGLPSDAVLAVEPHADGAWVGTSRGLAFVRAEAATARASDVELRGLAGTPVWALYAAGDALWIATDAGLAVLRTPADTVPVRPDAAADPRLRSPVRALAGADTEVVVYAGGELLRVDARTGKALPRLLGVDAPAVGTITRLAMDARTLWIAGALGVLVVSRETGVSRFLAIPRDLPAEPYALSLAPDLAWVGTRAGLVRVRRLPDGLVR